MNGITVVLRPGLAGGCHHDRAVRQNLVADGEFGGLGFQDLTGEVDARHERVLTDLPASRSQRQRVLVVDARIGDPEGDIARRQ